LARQPLLHLRVILLVRIHNGYRVVLALVDQPVEVRHAASASADLDVIEFAARLWGGEQIGERKEGCGGQRAGGQRGALEKRATVQGKVHNQEQLRPETQRPGLLRSIAGPIRNSSRVLAPQGNMENNQHVLWCILATNKWALRNNRLNARRWQSSC